MNKKETLTPPWECKEIPTEKPQYDHWITLEVNEAFGFEGTMHCAHPTPNADVPFFDRPSCWQPMLDEYDEDENQLPDLESRILERGTCLVTDWYQDQGIDLFHLGHPYQIESLPLYIQYWWEGWDDMRIAPAGREPGGYLNRNRNRVK